MNVHEDGLDLLAELIKMREQIKKQGGQVPNG